MEAVKTCCRCSIYQTKVSFFHPSLPDEAVLLESSVRKPDRPTGIMLLLVLLLQGAGAKEYTKEDLHRHREEVRGMFQHAYNSYLEHAYPYDELRPLSCDGVDTWGSYSLTLIGIQMQIQNNSNQIFN